MAQRRSTAWRHHEEPQVGLYLIASQAHGTHAECFHPDRDPFWWNIGREPSPGGRRRGGTSAGAWAGRGATVVFADP